MQASTVHPVTNFTTTAQNTTTKSPQQILIQSSGAIIAIIVIAIIIILAILLIILKTYNRRTHAARILTGSSNNQRKNTSAHSNMVMGNIRGNSGLGSFAQSTAPPENGFHLPRVDLGTVNHLGTADQRPIEQFSTTSGSTVVTIHDTPSVGNT
ncbi:noncompact myelin-associated protein [Astyanax mexicanus]|uniref:noncompact myelin-associated protein n=1 Tax=Astyanax mexicanus TaxID=7994 RepID=UPI000BBDBAD9|nr:noncompact myelin-associated protein [Astyanax mexicanus]